jgi:hypothetical protein
MLTIRGQNQILPSQQVLTPTTTHNALTSRLLAAPGARRRLHSLEETRQNDIHESSLGDPLCHYHTHVQNKYFEHTPPIYYGIDIGHCNRRSTPNSWAPKSLIDKVLGDNPHMHMPKRMSISPYQ